MSFLKISGRKNNVEISPEDIFLDSRNLSGLATENAAASFKKPVLKDSLLFSLSFLIIMFSVFTYKAYTLQIRDTESWLAKAESNYTNKSPIFAYRGMIKDRNGVPLAWNDSLDSKLEAKTLAIPKRHYIESEGFSNLLGFVNYPKKDKSGIFWRDDYVGIDGLEKYYNTKLSGEKGERVVELNVKGEIVKDNTLNAAKEGEVLELNIDTKAQSIFYNRLKEVVDAQGFAGGSGVLMDVNSGEVIVAASYPDYNNNIFVNASSTFEHDIKENYLKDKKTPMLNRAISGLYTPGSVVKPFMAYAALNEGVIDQFKSILSTGKLIIKNRYDGPDTIFRDWKAHGYVDAREAIAVSSDEYFYQVGGGYKDQPGLGIKRIDNYMSMFGFASSTGVDFVSEKDGIIPTPEWKKKNFQEGDWLLGNTYHSSIGQYGFKTSPLGLARSIAAVANGGILVSPKIAKIKEVNTIKKDINLNLDKKYLEIIQEGMHKAASTVGTAHYFEDLPFEVAAKTGTAQLGLKNEKVNSWSTGYYPYNNPSIPPKYVFVFMMENGPSTNTVGASKIMRKVFQDMQDLNMDYIKF